MPRMASHLPPTAAVRAPSITADLSPTGFRRPAGIDLIGEGRREILIELCRNPDVSASDVGERLFLSPGAVRLHLRGLLADGLVEYVAVRGSVGRPRHIYRLTRLGRSLFPSASEQILIGVLERLQSGEPAAYDRVMREIEDAFAVQSVGGDRPSAVPMEQRAEQLETVATKFGHECEATITDGHPEYHVYSCAIFEVARKNPRICEAERRWLERYFPESSVGIESWMVRGDLFCRFRGAPMDDQLTG
jgi:DeoR family transcriptional regulator, suf operon transcriptional repressor